METFVIETCCVCGIRFGIHRDHQSLLKKTKKSFFCPNGHSQAYTISEADVLKEQLEKSQREFKELEARKDETIQYYARRNRELHCDLTKAKNSNRSLKATKTKAVKRLKNDA